MGVALTSKLMVSLTAIAAALAIAACGGDDEESGDAPATTTTPALTEVEFLEEGNAICAAGNEEIDAASQEIAGQEDAVAFVEETLVPSIQGQLDGLGELQAPPELEADVETLLADAQSALGEIEADPESVLSGGDPFADVNQQATDIGLEECAG